MLYPQPQRCKVYRSFSFGFRAGIKLSYCSPKQAASVFETVFGKDGTADNINLQIIEAHTKELTYIAESCTLSSEIYKLLITENGGKVNIQIQFAARQGLIHALFTIKRMISEDDFPVGEILDYPLFSKRGYIEGFYGKPWNNRQRAEMLETMASYGENTYYYSPKDDLYLRKKWRQLYPADKLAEIAGLINRANELCIDFYFCLSPGLNFKYSSMQDFGLLCEKTEQLYKAGAKNFGLFLDDIPPELYYDEDKEKYTETVNAHIDLCLKYHAFLCELDSGISLTVCPMQYCGKGNEYYISRLGVMLPPEVSLFFTGPDICSREITVNNAECFYSSAKRKPLYWDNYPVNDAEMFKEMHIAPLSGRDKELYLCSEGLISNCMEYYKSSQFALITAACYLWNPVKYEPEEAFNNAVKALLPKTEKEDFMLLSEHFRTSCLRDENSRFMNEVFFKATLQRENSDMTGALRTVAEYASSVHLAAARLGGRHSDLYFELGEWINKFCLMSQILDMCVMAMSAGTKDTISLKQQIKTKLNEYNSNATVLTAFSFREFAETVLEIL